MKYKNGKRSYTRDWLIVALIWALAITTGVIARHYVNGVINSLIQGGNYGANAHDR